MNSSCPLPDQWTLRPDRRGLVYHEVVADGLIHAGAFSGIERDEAFGERMLTLAFVNGVRLVDKTHPCAAHTARRLRESTEQPADRTARLAQELAALLDAPDQPLLDRLRSHFRATQGTAELDLETGAGATSLRQSMGEALLAGLHLRGLAPEAFAALRGFLLGGTVEVDFLASRAWSWALAHGVPRAHPLIEMAMGFYRDHRGEHDLIVEGMASALPAALDLVVPHDEEFWIAAGRRHGRETSTFAPDLLFAAREEFSAARLAYNDRVLHQGLHIVEERGADACSLAFTTYLTSDNPLGLGDPKVRARCPMAVAQRAYDYAFWLAVLEQRPRFFATEPEAPREDEDGDGTRRVDED